MSDVFPIFVTHVKDYFYVDLQGGIGKWKT